MAFNYLNKNFRKLDIFSKPINILIKGEEKY